MNVGNFILSKEDILRKCVAILGIRGSGKSNTAMVLSEELVREGVPVTIVDPDGEYQDLMRVMGGRTIVASELKDPFSEAYLDVKEGRNCSIDMEDWNSDSFENLAMYLEGIWKTSREFKKDRFIVVEEAHEFIPQGRENQISDVLTRIALRGRKRGLGLLIISQRSAKVSKNVLTQGEIYFLHKVVHPADMRVYKELIPISSSEVEREIASLKVGEALLYMNGEVKQVKVRKFEIPLALNENDKVEALNA